MELKMADLRFDLNDMCNQEDKRRIEELKKINDKILEDYSALENTKNEQIRNLETSLDACNMKLKKRNSVKRLKVGPKKKHFTLKSLTWSRYTDNRIGPFFRGYQNIIQQCKNKENQPKGK